MIAQFGSMVFPYNHESTFMVQ